MGKQVVHLFGAAGSGTSTLGRYISEKTGFHFMDTDDYFWEATDPPYTTKRAVSERLRLLREEIGAHDAVVLSGSLVGWGDELIPLFTLAIRVAAATPVRLERLRRREREHFGSRIDSGGDMYEIHRDFLIWAASYDDGGLDSRSRAQHDRWQKKLACPVLLVDGSAPLERNFERIKEHLTV